MSRKSFVNKGNVWSFCLVGTFHLMRGELKNWAYEIPAAMELAHWMLPKAVKWLPSNFSFLLQKVCCRVERADCLKRNSSESIRSPSSLMEPPKEEERFAPFHFPEAPPSWQVKDFPKYESCFDDDAFPFPFAEYHRLEWSREHVYCGAKMRGIITLRWNGASNGSGWQQFR